MQNISALNIPQSGPVASRYAVALIDVIAGIKAVEIWGRLGWRENKRRYRRTVFGPLWTTVSLAVFVITLGLVWSNLWHNEPKDYLPFLTSGMLCWVLFSTICAEGCGGIISGEALIKQLRISYTLLACAIVWRNVIVFFHNLSVYVLICIYAGVNVTWATLLAVPGLFLLCLNGLWMAVLLGAVCARYRDVQQLVGNILQISLFLTPIFWSADQLDWPRRNAGGLQPALSPHRSRSRPVDGQGARCAALGRCRGSDAARLGIDYSRYGQVSSSHRLLALAVGNRALAQITLNDVVTEFPIYGAQPSLRSALLGRVGGVLRRGSNGAGKRVVVRALDQRVAYGQPRRPAGHSRPQRRRQIDHAAGACGDLSAKPRLDQY